MFVRIVTTSPLRNPIPYSLCVSTSICVEAQLLVPLTRKFRNCQRDHRFSEHLYVVYEIQTWLSFVASWYAVVFAYPEGQSGSRLYGSPLPWKPCSWP